MYLNPLEEEAEEEEAVAAPIGQQWSPFESLMIQKMDAMLGLHHEHATEVHASLEDISTRLGNLEARMSLRDLDD